MAKADTPRMLLDSSVFLAWLKGENEIDEIKEIFDFLDRREGQMCESTLLLAEVYPRRKDNDEVASDVRSLIERLHPSDVMLCDVTTSVAKLAAQYRDTHRMKAPDAVHLATAVLNKCGWLVTLDTDFPKIAETQVYNPRNPDDQVTPPWKRPVQQELYVTSPGDWEQD